MSIGALRKILCVFFSCRERANTYWHRYYCLFGAYLEGGSASFDRSVRFNVKVRSDGLGHVSVGPETSLGFPGAMKVGDGEILLQARTPSSVLVVGPGCRLNNNVTIIACLKVILGADCLVGDGVAIYDADFHSISSTERHNSTGECAPVTIGNNVWLGSRAMILKGVTIGDNSVIAPMSVVTRSIDANVMAAGIPARKVRDID